MKNVFVWEIIILLLLLCCPVGQEFIYNVNNFPLICQVKKRQVCLKAENLSKFVPSFSTTFLSLAHSLSVQLALSIWWAGGDIYTMKISENLFFHFYLKNSLQSSTIIPSKLIHGIYGVVTDSKPLIRNLLVLNWQGRHTGLHGMKTRSSQIYRSGSNIVDMIFICLTWMMPPFQSCKVFRYFPLYSVRLWRIETAIKLWKYLP